jgi:geranylgeranyl pyrophosphate synthase
MDDLVDLLSPPSKTGKDALRDLLLGRPSLPLHLLRERATGDDAQLLESVIGKQVVDIGERAALIDLMERTGVVAACAERIRVEIEGAARVAAEAGFPEAAREGMSVFERSLLAYATATIEASRHAG